MDTYRVKRLPYLFLLFLITQDFTRVLLSFLHAPDTIAR